MLSAYEKCALEALDERLTHSIRATGGRHLSRPVAKTLMHDAAQVDQFSRMCEKAAEFAIAAAQAIEAHCQGVRQDLAWHWWVTTRMGRMFFAFGRRDGDAWRWGTFSILREFAVFAEPNGFELGGRYYRSAHEAAVWALLILIKPAWALARKLPDLDASARAMLPISISIGRLGLARLFDGIHTERERALAEASATSSGDTAPAPRPRAGSRPSGDRSWAEDLWEPMDKIRDRLGNNVERGTIIAASRERPPRVRRRPRTNSPSPNGRRWLYNVADCLRTWPDHPLQPEMAASANSSNSGEFELRAVGRGGTSAH
jgi:hypothetical protein